MSDRDKLVQEALDAMTAAGRLPEPLVLGALPDEVLRAIIARFTGPQFVA
jgi:hypothetical protein